MRVRPAAQGPRCCDQTRPDAVTNAFGFIVMLLPKGLRWWDGLSRRRLGGMRFAGVLGEEAPDPRRQRRERARHMPVPVTDPDADGPGVDIGANAVLTAPTPPDALPCLEVAFAVRPV